jgi:hypothetical protein
MKQIILKFNILDLHFLIVIWIVILFNVSVTFMFFVIPNKKQYLYSLVFEETNQKSWKFAIFLVIEIYSKISISHIMATDGLVYLPFTIIAAFWLEFAKYVIIFLMTIFLFSL